MELSLKMEGIKCARQIWRWTVTREELSEHIVPDSCPDVNKILDVECQTFLTRAEAAEGRVDLSASVLCQILYLPEGSRELIPVVVNFPVQFMEERAGVTGKSVVQANVRASRVEVRMLNPRKMLIRIELIFEVLVLQREEQLFCGQLPVQEGLYLQQQSTTAGGRFIVAAPVKPFSFSDRLSFPGSRPAAVKILKKRGQVEVSDGRVVGSKVVLKGNVKMKLLCQEESGGVFPVDFELPFSQIMDGEGAEEGSDVDAEILITGIRCTLEDGGRSVDMELELLASAVVSQDRSVTLVTDAYSPLCSTELRCREAEFVGLTDSGTRRQSVRTNIETPGEWETLSDLWAAVGLLTQVRDGKICRITADVRLCALGRQEDGTFCSVEKMLPVILELETPEEDEVQCSWELAELHGDLTAGGVEAKLTLIYRYKILKSKSIQVISGVVLDEAEPYDLSGKPSLVMRRTEKETTLWNLAKEHLTTVDAIQRANNIEGDELTPGQFILIPKFR